MPLSAAPDKNVTSELNEQIAIPLRDFLEWKHGIESKTASHKAALFEEIAKSDRDPGSRQKSVSTLSSLKLLYDSVYFAVNGLIDDIMDDVRHNKGQISMDKHKA
jgi:hypothetical protein